MASGVIRCIHLFTGADGQSHVEALDVPLGAIQSATAAHFEETAAGSALDWHTAPCNQYVVTLSGTRATARRSFCGQATSCSPPTRPELGIAGG
jgi:hypothetical protein